MIEDLSYKTPCHDGRRLGGANIFNLPTTYIVDNPLFWYFCLGMILFMIGIDRIQWLLTLWTGDEYARDIFIQRINAEMLMFGIVAITIFVFQVCVLSLDDKQHKILHFVDLLCSCGALMLIFFGGLLMSMMSILTRGYIRKQGNTTNIVEEHYIVARAFLTRWSVPHSFNYDLYMKHALSNDIGILITLDWAPWAVLLVPTVAGLVVSYTTDGNAIKHETKLLGYFMFNCIWLVLMAIFACAIYRQRMQLRQHVGADHPEIKTRVMEAVHAELRERGHLPPVASTFAVKLFECAGRAPDYLPPAPKRYEIEFMHRGLQTFSLGFAMSGALYLCHFLAGIEVNSASPAWHIACLLPILLGFGLLPWSLHHLIHVYAVLAPSAEVVDRVIRETRSFDVNSRLILEQIDNGMRRGFLCAEVVEKFCSTLDSGAVINTVQELQKYLQQFHVYISLVSLRKMMTDISPDAKFKVSYAEFFRSVFEGFFEAERDDRQDGESSQIGQLSSLAVENSLSSIDREQAEVKMMNRLRAGKTLLDQPKTPKADKPKTSKAVVDEGCKGCPPVPENVLTEDTEERPPVPILVPEIAEGSPAGSTCTI